MKGSVTFQIRFKVEAEEVDHPDQIAAGLYGLLWKQIKALYGNHWLLPMTQAAAVLVEVTGAVSQQVESVVEAE